jgi:ZIP family zinc transporter
VLVLFAVLPFFSTLLGGFAALRLRHQLRPIMAFASGVLVATALADLLPEARDLIGDAAGDLPVSGIAAVVGFLLFTTLEAFVHRESWEHGHRRSALASSLPKSFESAGSSDHGPSALGFIGPLGLVVHSTLDGLAIGLAFRAGSDVGLLVGLAVLAHDFADGMNVVTLAVAGGRALSGATILLVMDAIAPVAGAALGTVITLDPVVLGVLLSTFAGVFLAIGAGHLLPEAQHQRPGSSPLLVLLTALGTALVIAIRFVIG